MSGLLHVLDRGTTQIVSANDMKKRISEATKFLTWIRSRENIYLKCFEEDKKDILIQDKGTTIFALGTSFAILLSPELLEKISQPAVKRQLVFFIFGSIKEIVMQDLKIGVAGSLFADVSTNDYTMLPKKLRIGLYGLQDDDGKLTHQIPFKTNGTILYVRVDIL